MKPSEALTIKKHEAQLRVYEGDKIIVMQKGKIVEMAEADELYLNPQSEYTKKLIEAIPTQLV
jgi:peptide/nickel transport system ATP-binding protein